MNTLRLLSLALLSCGAMHFAAHAAGKPATMPALLKGEGPALDAIQRDWDLSLGGAVLATETAERDVRTHRHRGEDELVIEQFGRAGHQGAEAASADASLPP